MRNLRTEEEITANWKGDINQPVVSICCITYNHEPYIEDALEGFLIQETDFPFEILIHDDASTDHTAEIIHEYEAKYPRLIKPIYQTENQYSKGLRMNPAFNFPRAKGEYIALCEGDDYWVSPGKLKTQVELMRHYPEINISFHPAYKVDGHKLKKDEVFSNHGNELKIFTPEEVILGDGGFMPTQSLMLKSNVMKQLPDWFFKYAPVGDYYLQMIASIDKGALFIPKIMSCYRVNIVGSWTASQANKKRDEWLAGHFRALKEMNSFYNRVYENYFKTVFTKYLVYEITNPNYSSAEKRKMVKEYSAFIKGGKTINLVLLSWLPPFFVSSIKKIKAGLRKCAA